MPKDTGIQVEQDELGSIDLRIAVTRDLSGKITKGMAVGNTLEQNKALILMAKQGEIKWRPDLGVGIGDMLLSEEYLGYRHKIREHFAKDGLKTTRVDLYRDKPIRIIAEYDS